MFCTYHLSNVPRFSFLPKPWNEDTGGFDISAVVLATGFEFAGFDEGDAGEFEEEEEEDGWYEPEVGAIEGIPAE